MTRQEKEMYVDNLVEQLNTSSNIYLANIAGLDAEKSAALRGECFKSEIKLQVVKNTLLKRAFDKSEKDFGDIDQVLVENTSILFAETANGPAKLIKKLGKQYDGVPSLKAAYVEEEVYVGADKLELLVNIKSKNELIADVVGLLQSPLKTVVSQLNSGKDKLSGIVKTLSEKSE